MSKKEFENTLWKTGSSLVVTVPARIIKRLGLKEGDQADFTIEKIEEKK